MSGLQPQLHDRYWSPGGVIGYPLDRLYEEVAYIAYHFHWSPEYILAMEHRDRHAWAEQIAALNRRLSEAVD